MVIVWAERTEVHRAVQGLSLELSQGSGEPEAPGNQREVGQNSKELET